VACKCPLGGRPATFAPAPSGGGTWYLHCDIRDCVQALRLAQTAPIEMNAPTTSACEVSHDPDQRLRGQP